MVDYTSLFGNRIDEVNTSALNELKRDLVRKALENQNGLDNRVALVSWVTDVPDVACEKHYRTLQEAMLTAASRFDNIGPLAEAAFWLSANSDKIDFDIHMARRLEHLSDTVYVDEEKESAQENHNPIQSALEAISLFPMDGPQKAEIAAPLLLLTEKSVIKYANSLGNWAQIDDIRNRKAGTILETGVIEEGHNGELATIVANAFHTNFSIILEQAARAYAEIDPARTQLSETLSDIAYHRAEELKKAQIDHTDRRQNWKQYKEEALEALGEKPELSRKLTEKESDEYRRLNKRYYVDRKIGYHSTEYSELQELEKINKAFENSVKAQEDWENKKKETEKAWTKNNLKKRYNNEVRQIKQYYDRRVEEAYGQLGPRMRDNLSRIRLLTEAYSRWWEFLIYNLRLIYGGRHPDIRDKSWEGYTEDIRLMATLATNMATYMSQIYSESRTLQEAIDATDGLIKGSIAVESAIDIDESSVRGPLFGFAYRCMRELGSADPPEKRMQKYTRLLTIVSKHDDGANTTADLSNSTGRFKDVHPPIVYLSDAINAFKSEFPNQ